MTMHLGIYVALVVFILMVYGAESMTEFKNQVEAEQVASLLLSFNRGDPRPPIVLIPGIVATRMIAWKRKKCMGPHIDIQDVVWLNLQKLVETLTYDKNCWLDCMKLGQNGTDPSDCKIRPDEGLDAVGELSPGLYRPAGTSIFTPLIRTLARDLGYDSNSLLAAPYDWRLAPMELEERDSYFTSLKFKIESAVQRHQRPAVIIAHSMGNNLFQYFIEWLRKVNKPSIGWKKWVYRNIWAHVGLAAPLLGAPPALKAVLSGHTFSLPISPLQARELMLTFPVTHYLNPRPHSKGGGEYWQGSIVTLRNATHSGEELRFNLTHIISGEVYNVTGELYEDPLLMEKYNTLYGLYKTDPLSPLGEPPQRPPIRHVIMLYGVDLSTEVSYTYQLPSAEMGRNSRGGIDPPLEETWVEIGDNIVHKKPEEKQKGHVNSNAPPFIAHPLIQHAFNLLNMRNSNNNGNGSDNSTDSSDSTDDNDPSRSSNSFDESTENIGDSEAVSEPIVKGQGDSSEEAVQTFTEESLTYCLTVLLQEKEEQSNPIDPSQPSCDNNNHYENDSKNGEKGINKAIISSTTVIKEDIFQEINEDTIGISEEVEEDSPVQPPVFSANIYSIKHLGGKKGEKTFLHPSPLSHSGDNTVAYYSLSYAKEYLNDYHLLSDLSPNISKQCVEQVGQEKGKECIVRDDQYYPPHIQNPQHVLDSQKTLSPRMEVFSSVLHDKAGREGGSTWVVEVGGADHLDIAKDSSIHSLLLSILLPRMTKDLCVGNGERGCNLYYDKNP